MQGFNIHTKDINQLINKIEREINQIATNLNRNVQNLSERLDANTKELVYIRQLIDELIDYTEDYEEVKERIKQLMIKVGCIKEKINHLCSTVSLDDMAKQEGWIWQPGDE